MDRDALQGCLTFLRETERLKDVLRSAYTSSGRRESTAEHTWRLCLMAMVFERELGPIDFARLLKICIVHDLGEAVSGDIPAVEQRLDMNKAENERRDFLQLLAPLDEERRTELLALWDEYDRGSSPEAMLVKGLDKLETILQHNQGKNPPEFDYAFNLTYGEKYTSGHPLLRAIREMLDRDTSRRADGLQSAP